MHLLGKIKFWITLSTTFKIPKRSINIGFLKIKKIKNSKDALLANDANKTSMSIFLKIKKNNREVNYENKYIQYKGW